MQTIQHYTKKKSTQERLVVGNVKKKLKALHALCQNLYREKNLFSCLFELFFILSKKKSQKKTNEKQENENKKIKENSAERKKAIISTYLNSSKKTTIIT